jgi:hypothetical protein
MPTKLCSRCKAIKDVEEFRIRQTIDSKVIRTGKCKECMKEIWQNDIEKRLRHLQYGKNWTVKNRGYNTFKIVEYLKSHPCVDCGESDICVLDFDHISNKTYGISNLIRRGKWSVILKEISKCVVRCANCHRKKTAIEQGWLKLQIINDPNFTPPPEPLQKTHEYKSRKCLICENQFPINYAHRNQKYCSRKCTNRAREVIDWPSNEILLQLDTKFTRKELAVKFNVPAYTVKRRIRRARMLLDNTHPELVAASKKAHTRAELLKLNQS